MESARILVVEDEAIFARDLKLSLEEMGHEVPWLESRGERAVKVAEESRPDLVLMDIALAGELDGLEAATRIHESTGIPVVFLTAYGDAEFLERAQASRPQGYLLKPVDYRTLAVNLELALARARLEREGQEVGAEAEGDFLCMCCSCKKIRDQAGQWCDVAGYIAKHFSTPVSHGMCPECMAEFYPDLIDPADG